MKAVLEDTYVQDTGKVLVVGERVIVDFFGFGFEDFIVYEIDGVYALVRYL